MKQRSILTLLFWLMTISVTIPAILLLGYFGLLFVAHNFDPNFLQIDNCLDIGGTWNDNLQMCQH